MAALPDDKGKPRETVGRKATGRCLTDRVVTAGLPEATMVAPTDRRPNVQLGPWPKQELIVLAEHMAWARALLNILCGDAVRDPSTRWRLA